LTQSPLSLRRPIFVVRGNFATWAAGLAQRRPGPQYRASPLLETDPMTAKPLLLTALLIGLASPALAQRGGHQGERRPETFEALVHCRTIADSAARLQCYDAAAAALEQAAERRDVVVVDRAQVRESRRRLFGLALPHLPIFGGGDNDNDRDDQEISQIDSTIASAVRNDLGQWQVRLQDGGTWIQTDFNLLAVAPRPGQPVVIHRGALGSYMMRVNRQPGVRVRRVL
jgi:hypothetical protein